MILTKYITIFFFAATIALIIHKVEGGSNNYSQPDVAQNDQIIMTEKFTDTQVVIKIINQNLTTIFNK